MITGHFYYIKDEFYDALPNSGLMTNKPDDITGHHGRPCHYCFEHEGLFWMVPISSQVGKYEALYNYKVQKYGKCDSISFGFVNGRRSAFLIQNTFPVSANYIESEYFIQKGAVAVTVNEKTSNEINKLVRKVIRLHAQGKRSTLTDIDSILSFLSL